MMNSKVRFDSVYGIAEGCSIFIVYENSKTYSRYKIKFSDFGPIPNKES